MDTCPICQSQLTKFRSKYYKYFYLAAPEKDCILKECANVARHTFKCLFDIETGKIDVVRISLDYSWILMNDYLIGKSQISFIDAATERVVLYFDYVQEDIFNIPFLKERMETLIAFI